jgi:1-aminocyclopropane-1-carboxylate deaminase
MIHKLPCLSTKEACVYILRDDLLNPPFSGSKHRKYEGLFLKIIDDHIETLMIPGSMASNHFVTSIYLAKKHNIQIKAFCKKPYGTLRANAQAVKDLLSDDELVFCDDPWQEAQSAHLKTLRSYVMPLGGYSKEAAQSALSLGYDIMQFASTVSIDHIFLDAGTGLQAASCLLAMQEMGYKGSATVVRMGNLDFDKVIKEISDWTLKSLPSFAIDVIPPSKGKMYGSRNRDVDFFSEKFESASLIKLDPVYNSKLFYTLDHMIQTNKVQGTLLVVHSGGTYSGTISE